MTNEQAIEILRDTPIDIRSTREDDIHTLYATAQNMAIEALQKQVTAKLKNPDFSLITEASSNSNEQKSKLDLINRQDAIDAFRKRGDEIIPGGILRGTVYEVLENLPSAQPEPRWIPCSERLPENGHYYLWCSDMGSVQSDYYWNGFENGMKYGYNIVAWMPLPEPYKGGDTYDE